MLKTIYIYTHTHIHIHTDTKLKKRVEQRNRMSWKFVQSNITGLIL